MGGVRQRARIERVSADDAMELALPGPVPMQFAAVLLLDGSPDPDAVRRALADRVPAVPRLRQRLMRSPFGGGRPVWVDDPAFDIRRHVR